MRRPKQSEKRNFSLIEMHNVYVTSVYPVYARDREAGMILCMRLANERQHYHVTSSHIGWAHAQNNLMGTD